MALGHASCRGMLEAAWRRALAATDWDALAADRTRSSDADFGRRLGATLVARAAARCFSPFPEHRVPLEPRCADRHVMSCFDRKVWSVVVRYSCV